MILDKSCRFRKTVLKLALATLIILLLSQTVLASDWPMFHKDASHTGSINENLKPPLNLVWQFKSSYPIRSSPAVYQGVVYFGAGMCSVNTKGGVYALDVRSGKEQWKYMAGEVESSPAVTEDSVYFGSCDTNVYAIDRRSGALKWIFKTDNSVKSSPVIYNDIVYVGSEDSNLYAIDAKNGTLKWKYLTDASIESSPAIVDSIIYFGSQDNYVYALNADTGILKWKYKTRFFVTSSPTIVDGIVYVGSYDTNLYALDGSTGSLLWNYQSEGYIFSSPAYSDGMVYTGSRSGHIYGIDAKNGNSIWSFKTGGFIEYGPSVANGIVYIGSEDKYFYALDAKNGNLLWKYLTKNAIWGSPAISEGIVYIGSMDGNLYAFGDEKLYPGNQIDTPPEINSSQKMASSKSSPTIAIKSTVTASNALETNWTLIGGIAVFILTGAIALRQHLSRWIPKRQKKIKSVFDHLRGYTVLSNNDLKFGIRLINDTNFVITDVDVILDYAKNLFSMKESEIQHLGNITPNGKRTATYLLKPLGCIHNEQINALITYKDHTGKKQTLHMRPKEVHCVCPFLKEKPMSEGEYSRLTVSSEFVQEGISFKGISVEDLSKFMSETCRHTLHKVREYDLEGKKVIYLSGESVGERTYYLLTAVIQDYKGLTQVVLRAHSDKKYGLNGFMNEMADSLRHLVGSVQNAKEIGIIENTQVINIIDSVVQRTSFNMGEGGKSNVNIKDSVVQRSEIGKE